VIVITAPRPAIACGGRPTAPVELNAAAPGVPGVIVA
jgi:hypothetical protein